DVVVAEILLNFAHDVGHHLFRILARDSRLRDRVEESGMLGATLFFGEQARILDRYSKLTGCCAHLFQIASLNNIFPFCADSCHNASRHASQPDGNAAERLAWSGRYEVDAWLRTSRFELRLNQKWLPGANDVLGETVH